MNYSSKLSGLKRTRWDTKTTSQKQDILKSHYTNLGYSIPKYLDSDKLSNKQLGQALNKISKGYTSRTQTKQVKIDPLSSYNNTVKKFNSKVELLNTKFKDMGLSELELNYLKGKEIHVPRIRDKSFHSDKIEFQKIENQKFSNKQAMVEETKRIKQTMRNLNKMLNADEFYNINENKKAFENMISHSAFSDFDKDDIDYLRMHYDNLTPFEQELYMKSRFNELRDKYKYLFEEGSDDRANEELYNALLYGTRNTHKAISGNDLLLSKSGKLY